MNDLTKAAVGAAKSADDYPGEALRSAEVRRNELLAEVLRRWRAKSPRDAEAFAQGFIWKNPGLLDALKPMALSRFAELLELLHSYPIATMEDWSDAEFDQILLSFAALARLEFDRTADPKAAGAFLQALGPRKGFDWLLIRRAERAFAASTLSGLVPADEAATAALAPLRLVFDETRRFDPGLRKRIHDSIHLHTLNAYAGLKEQRASIGAADTPSPSAASGEGGEEADEVIRDVGGTVEVAEARSGHVGDGDGKPTKGDAELSRKRKESVSEWKKRQPRESKPRTNRDLFTAARVHETEFYSWQRGELRKGTKVDQRIREVLGRDGRISPVSPVDL